MAAYLSDTFTATATTALDAHTPDVGVQWTKISGGPIYVVTAGYASPNATGYYINTTTPPDTGGIKFTFDHTETGTSSSSYMAVVFQSNAAGTTCYTLSIMQATVTLAKLVNNVSTNLQTWSGSGIGWGPTVNVKATWEIDVADGTISVYKNGSLIGGYTDASPLSNGYVGISPHGTTLQIDNLSAEPLTNPVTAAIFTVAGSGTATGVGSKVVAAKAVAAGVAVVTGIEGITREGEFSSAGTSTASAKGVKFVQGQATSNGQGTAQAVGLTVQIKEATFSAAGEASASARGSHIVTATGSAEGTSTAQAIVDNTYVGSFSATGKATSSFVGLSGKAASFAASGSSDAQAVGQTIVVGEASFAISGKALVAGVGRATATAVGHAAGVGLAGAREVVPTAAKGTAAGKAAAVAVGQRIITGVFSAAGRATVVAATGTSIVTAIGVAVGTSASQFSDGTKEASFAILGSSTAAFVGHSYIRMPVPPERTIILTGEDREIILTDPGLRGVALDAASRTIALPVAESRTVILPLPDSRTIIMPPDDRAVSLTIAARIAA